MQKQMKIVLSGIISIVLFTSLISFSAVGKDKSSLIHSDTTKDMDMSLGEHYCFLVTPQDEDAVVNYTVGNGKILHTFVADPPRKNKGGSLTYCFGFSCNKIGRTGVYVNLNGKTVRLFSVNVKNTISFSDALGTNSALYSKVVIQHMSTNKTITNQNKIQFLLNDLSEEKLDQQSGDSPYYGWGYALHFYYKNGGGSYTYTDAYGFSEDNDCKINGPVGYYLPQNPNNIKSKLVLFYNQN